MISGEKYVAISVILPVTQLLKTTVLIERPNDNPMTSELRSSVISDLQTRNQDEDVSHLLETASFLDPRLKEKYCLDAYEVKERIISEDASLDFTSEPDQSLPTEAALQDVHHLQKKTKKTKQNEHSNQYNF